MIYFSSYVIKLTLERLTKLCAYAVLLNESRHTFSGHIHSVIDSPYKAVCVTSVIKERAAS